MDITELVQKQNPDFGRSALFEAFVNAHFDGVTGELLGKEYEFHRVLNLLGRKDLDFGDIPVRIGKVSFEEKKEIHARFLGLKRNAPKVKKEKTDSIKVGPYLKKLGTTELMAIEAFDSSGNLVTNPAVATTLAQAHLEGWISVKSLPMDAKEILMQCMNQGDMQAAFLLGSKRVSLDKIFIDDGGYLVDKKEERRFYLTVAKAHGNPAAIDWFEQETMQEEMQEEMRDSDGDEECDQFYFDLINTDLQLALKMGPNSTGAKLFNWGVQLAESNQQHFKSAKNAKPDLSAYFSRHALAFQWIVEAAEENAEARHYLATRIDDFIFQKKDAISAESYCFEVIGGRGLTKAEKRLALIESAAISNEGIVPYYPAYIDLAEDLLSKWENSLGIASTRGRLIEKIQRYLIEIEKIEKPNCNQSIRIASIWEKITLKRIHKKSIQYYSMASEKSTFAAYKCAMLSLRSTKPDIESMAIRSLLELAVASSPRHGELNDSTAKYYAEIALEIGWGVDSEPWSWEKASMLLLRQLDRQRYVPDKQMMWLLPTDVESLLRLNPAYEKYKKWKNDWSEILSNEFKPSNSMYPETSIQYGWKDKFRSLYFLYGSSEPSAILKLLSARANDSNYLQSNMEPNEIDDLSILDKYLSSQSTLQKNDEQGKALWEFKKTLAMTEARQDGPSGRGASFVANSLQWLQKKSQDGMNDAQPNCRRVIISSEMNGPISEFGRKMLRIILVNIENESISGKIIATEIVYKDKFINTPIKVALVAKVIEEIVNYLKILFCWNNSLVKIYAGELPDTKNNYSMDRSMNRSDSFSGGPKERNEILHGILARSNIEASLMETTPPHSRNLVVRFNNNSELRVDIDMGMSFWDAAKEENDYILNIDINRKINYLTKNNFSIIGKKEDVNKIIVEWHKGDAVNSNISH